MISVSEHGYLIVIERGDGNFGAWAPDLGGCVAVGDTIEECEREMREAIAFHIEGGVALTRARTSSVQPFVEGGENASFRPRRRDVSLAVP